MLYGLRDTIINFVIREANLAAHRLVCFALLIENVSSWYGNPPDVIQDAIIEDFCNIFLPFKFIIFLSK